MKNDRKKILIALDYNPTAQKVAEAGYSMGKAMHADIILLHVISDSQYYASTDYSPIMGFSGYAEAGLTELNSADLKKASHLFLDKTKNHLNDTTLKTLISEGDFAEAIVKTAEEQHVDIIVLGSHSRRWLEEIVLGSVTKEVLRHSKVPLFIVPTNQKKTKPFLIGLSANESIPSN